MSTLGRIHAAQRRYALGDKGFQRFSQFFDRGLDCDRQDEGLLVSGALKHARHRQEAHLHRQALLHGHVLFTPHQTTASTFRRHPLRLAGRAGAF